ncbi:MAG TPA: hypothetical protein VGG82_08030 [Casimicrobiaceae bacterium]|jgi:hypothetical protein
MSLEIPETPSRPDSDYAVANSGKRRSCQFAIQKFQQMSRRVAVAHCAGVAPLLVVHELIVRVPCDERRQGLKTFDLTAQPGPRLTERASVQSENLTLDDPAFRTRTASARLGIAPVFVRRDWPSRAGS